MCLLLCGLQVGGWGEPHGKGFYVLEDGSKHKGEVPLVLHAHALHCEGGVSPQLGRAGEASAAPHLHVFLHSSRTGAPSGGVSLRGPTASATKASGRTGSLMARCALQRVGMGQTVVLRPVRLFRPVLPHHSIISAMSSLVLRALCAMHDPLQGVFTWRDGKRYEGIIVNGKQQGKGQFSWPVSLRAAYLQPRRLHA